MKRRDLIKSGLAGTSTVFASLITDRAANAEPPPLHAFTPCINQATTMKADFKTALDAYSKAGFRQVELRLDCMNEFLQDNSIAAAKRLLRDLNLDLRCACCECANLFYPGTADRDTKLEAFKRKLDVSAQLGAHRFTMCSGISKDVRPADYAAAVPMLHHAAHGLVPLRLRGSGLS